MESLYGFTDTEKEIIDLFLNQEQSIRQISKKYENYGRTRINNILNRYASLSSVNEKNIEARKKDSKNHRKKDKQPPKRVERKNSLVKDEFNSLNDKDKEDFIFKKLNHRRKKLGRNEYSVKMLQNKLNSLKEFFKQRNDRIEQKESIISKDDLYRMLYDYPTLLSSSLDYKIKPIINKLDNELLNYFQTSKIIKENPSILCSSILRTELQIKILKGSNTLDYAINKPRIFRSSPELLYALIKRWQIETEKISEPFISSLRLYQEFGKTSDELKEQFDIKAEYGNDKYFNGR